MSTQLHVPTGLPNGAALAAFTAAGVGAFAMGLISLLDAIGLLPLPELYAPAGGVSTRTTLAVATWLVAWVILHRRWKDRDLGTGAVRSATLVLIALGILLALPPVWSLFG